MMKNIKTDSNHVVIFGASGHGQVVMDIVERSKKETIVGFLDSYLPRGQNICGYKVLGDETMLPDLLLEYPNCGIFVAIGDNWTRSLIVERILKLAPKINFISVVHPSALIGKDVVIGKGVAIMPGVIINSQSVVGDFAIVNTKASVGHNGLVHEFVSLAPNVTLGGNVEVGIYSAISISATVLHGRKIEAHTVVGACSLVTKNCDGLSVFYGNPAKKIRARTVNDTYL